MKAALIKPDSLKIEAPVHAVPSPWALPMVPATTCTDTHLSAGQGQGVIHGTAARGHPTPSGAIREAANKWISMDVCKHRVAGHDSIATASRDQASRVLVLCQDSPSMRAEHRSDPSKSDLLHGQILSAIREEFREVKTCGGLVTANCSIA